uniref:Diphthine--ammonia ligase n=1 Tax=Caenorhabditis japonica TaxID=281687 RepID=A0A8R1I4A7_CAEJA
MKVVGLVSGGKDSCYNLMCAVNEGHEIVALANLHPPKESECEELDSYMYQSVGADGVELYGEAMGVPLYRRQISGQPKNQAADYEKTDGDEVEDLYELLVEVKKHHPDVQGVSAGAILSSYQKVRVEDVCRRLDLTPLCFLWEREQNSLLAEMVSSGLDAILIKVAAIGLGEQHLGRTLAEMAPIMKNLQDKYGVHPCGEGGEFESFVRDCSLFKRRIVIDETETVVHQDDPVAPVFYLRLKKMHLEDK